MVEKRTLTLISKTLIKRSETLAVSESVTAGLIANHLSLASNATSFFQGGLIAYNLGQKARHLNVDPIHAEQENCVSEKVAQQMAVNVAKLFISEWGIGVTGYAVPVPALNIKTCFVIYAFAFKGKVMTTACLDTKLRGQFQVQSFYASKIIEAFSDQIAQLSIS
ncbi:MAG TPA: CinA family protein [Chryseolinea sp.]|nr:CinA family protein [Chryseolinea sp.]